jgi:Lon protease-like protein
LRVEETEKKRRRAKKSGRLGMLSLLRRGVLAGRLPQRAAASTRLLPPSTLRVALCSSSSSNAGNGGGDGNGNGKKKPPTAAVAEADADADADVELYDETEVVQLVGVQDGGQDGEMPDDVTEALQKYDPNDISTMPPVVVFPFATRPIFPGIFQPCEVIDPRLVAALTAAKASHHPYVGVFLPKDKGEAGSGDSGKDVVPIIDPSELHDVGTLSQIMRLSPTPHGAQVLLMGGRRVTIDKVIKSPSSAGDVLEVKVKEAADIEVEPKTEDVAKAYAMEVMHTIKEILKLNPFFKEQMQMILERSEVHATLLATLTPTPNPNPHPNPQPPTPTLTLTRTR